VKLLLDHNLSFRLVPTLASLYPGSMHVRDLGLTTATDEVIWSYARQRGLVIVSKDSDFYHRSMVLGHPPKVVWLRVGNCTTATIQVLLQTRHADLLTFEHDLVASFLALA
jgi:predicted nuclease of predicted toxin-antitoxin system